MTIQACLARCVLDQAVVDELELGLDEDGALACCCRPTTPIQEIVVCASGFGVNTASKLPRTVGRVLVIFTLKLPVNLKCPLARAA
jgi:hypothetical protein